MLKTFARILALVDLTLLTIAFVSAQTPPLTLTIHADQPISKVSPTLYGLMTEEINYSYDGGLYAEMVNNRTFRSDWRGISHWFVVEDGDAQASISVDEQTGPSDALKHSLRLEVEKADQQNQAGVLDDGYWGMALKPDTAYKGSFFAKADSENLGAVTVSLVNDASGKTVSAATVSGISTAWKQYNFILKTGEMKTSADNHLSLTVGHAGKLWLSLVSLFPPTYHDRINGNRVDLMEKLAAMHPAFLRFPGGNYLEGDHIADRYDWKKTIGPLADRPTHPSPWSYHSTDGLGLLEFLEWCEDLKMQPVLAVYAGYSMAQEHVTPGANLDPYVQDALDEIEYVSGSTDTKWGAVRAKDGHADPFKLTYVEIGNEDNFDKSGSYEERYAQFYKTIKAKYPNLQLIATMPVKSIRPDVIDDHFYVRATKFFQDTTHYDKTDRNGPKIFVGEWATLEGSPTPNFGAALSDSAWMTGLERNSDIVVMAAYAPLLVNVNPGGMQWAPDLIGYGAMDSYGSPGYYAQVMFATYLGDETLASKLEGAGPANAGQKFFYSITRSSAKKQLYLKLVNASSEAQPLEIEVAGAQLVAAAKLISLSARSTQATNSIDQPQAIIPVESDIQSVSNHLHRIMPAYSIQVIQLEER